MNMMEAAASEPSLDLDNLKLLEVGVTLGISVSFPYMLTGDHITFQTLWVQLHVRSVVE